jgi:hypothetical protein
MAMTWQIWCIHGAMVLKNLLNVQIWLEKWIGFRENLQETMDFDRLV